MKILVVTGSSGGHIFPALAFLETLKGKIPDADTLLVLPNASRGKYPQVLGYKTEYISITAINKRLDPRNLVAVFNFLKGSLESFFILARFRADTVVGFGSISCVPLVLLAWLFRIKTVIHEQNVIPGLANRLLAIFADKIAVSFQESKKYFSRYLNKVVFTGNLMRKGLFRIEKNKALDFFGLSHDKFTILVLGGSQGSQSINAGFFAAILSLSGKYDLQVIHLTGSNDYESLKHRYEDSNIDFRVFSFLKDIQYAYSASDFVVCRAGANTITELIFFRLPAIIFPYPYAYRHQMQNAKVLEKLGSAIIIEDRQLNNGLLAYNIEILINDPERVKKMASAYDLVSGVEANDIFIDNVILLN